MAFLVRGVVSRFVKPEGIRCAVPAAELDTEATEKTNESVESISIYTIEVQAPCAFNLIVAYQYFDD